MLIAFIGEAVSFCSVLGFLRGGGCRGLRFAGVALGLTLGVALVDDDAIEEVVESNSTGEEVGFAFGAILTPMISRSESL